MKGIKDMAKNQNDMLVRQKATCNARYDDHGIIKEGAQVVLGANDKYIALCRKHFKEGNLGK